MDKAIEKMTYKCTSVASSRLSDSAEDAKVKGTRKVCGRGKGKSFLPFYFRVRAFSIQGARLSRSLRQASTFVIVCVCVCVCGGGGGGGGGGCYVTTVIERCY